MSSPSELSLDYKPNAHPMIQTAFGDQPAEQTHKLKDFLARLEEERHKIEAFKRELPLCMQLLNSAMETYKRQLETYQASQGSRPVIEEFIPLSNMSINGSEKLSTEVSTEKANWMVSAQLWSPTIEQAKQHSEHEAQPFSMSTKLAFDTKQRNCGAFLPFSKEKSIGASVRSLPSQGLPELALASGMKEVGEKNNCVEDEEIHVKKENNGRSGAHEQQQQQQQGKGSGSNHGGEGQSTHRKARRCWSPDLHRRFVNALHMLGGSQVATPKQIRELMKVDGLTNDEVKSHLQKYRLHTRRPIPPPQPPATAAPQLVVLGGIWVPPAYAAAAAAAGTSIYGAHPAQAHYSLPPDFYAAHTPSVSDLRPTAAAAAAAAAYRPRPNSPDSELPSSGDRSESIEEDGEEREVEEDEHQQEEEEEVKEGDNKALVPLEDIGSGQAAAVKF